MKKKFLFWLKFSLFFIVLPAFNSAASISKASLHRLTLEDGLTQVHITRLAQDKQGYIWIGTYNGINIYDGYTISSLPGPDNDFTKFEVDELFVSNDGLIWMSLYGKGLYTFNPADKSYQLIIKHNTDDHSSNIWKIIEDTKRNKYWFVTNKNLQYYDAKTQKNIHTVDFTPYLVEKQQLFNAHLYGDKLIVSADNGLYSVDIKTKEITLLPKIPASIFKQKPPSTIQFYDTAFSKDTFYIGTNSGVFRFSALQLQNYLDKKQQTITYNVAIDDIDVWHFHLTNEQLYVGTSQGLYRINSEQQKGQFFLKYSDHFNIVANDTVNYIISDHLGQLWLGSFTSGVYWLNPQTELITTYHYNNQLSNSLSSDKINAVTSVDEETLWVATNNGINHIDLSKGSVQHYLTNNNLKTTNSTGIVSNIANDHLGRLWLKTTDGIVIFDTVTKKIIQPNFPEKTLSLFDIGKNWAALTRIGQYIWMVYNRNIYKIHAGTGEYTEIKNIEVLSKNRYIWRVMKSFTQNPTDILISCSDSLWLYNDTSQKLKQIYVQKNIEKSSNTFLHSWLEDKNGLIWFSYPQVGLVALDKHTFQQKQLFNHENSELEPNAYNILMDEKEYIWLASTNGLFRIKPKSKEIQRFSTLDGLVSNEFNTDAFYSLKNGLFVYGGVSGINIFDPLLLGNKRKDYFSKVNIVNINALSRPLNVPHIIPNHYQTNLSQDDFGIKIEFSDFSYGVSEKSLYKYELVGQGAAIETHQNSVIFPYLDPGEYNFKVQVKSVVTGKYSQPTFLQLNVAYSTFKSPLAYSIYILIILTLFILWFRGRQLKQKELLEAHKQVVQREKRLELALSAGNSEVWDWLADNNCFIAKRYLYDLQHKFDDDFIDFAQHCQLIHPTDQESYIAKWQKFIKEANPDIRFECTYRLKSANNQWLWYRDLGKIVAFDELGLPTKITGSYNNITNSRAIQERALCYGAAFEQTRDWVLIFDQTFEVARTNKSMADVFGWQNTELQLHEEINGLSHDQLEKYHQLFPFVEQLGYWSDEEVILAPNGIEYNVITKITVSNNNVNDTKYFICVFTDITPQKKAEKELRVLANYDHLTGLPNRALLTDTVNNAIASSLCNKNKIALFFIDLDKFKHVNDSLGHDYGDLLLQQVSQRLNKIMRGDDTVARIGGDEFVILVEHFNVKNDLAIVAKKVIKSLTQTFELKKHSVNIGASIGIAIFPNDANNADDFFKYADQAMYYVKQSGRNNYQFFDDIK